MNKALTLDPQTDDLTIVNSTLVLGRAETTVASIVTQSCRGELKELPLIGGEAQRQLGSARADLWLVRLRKNLTAVGLHVDTLSLDKNTNTLTIQVR